MPCSQLGEHSTERPACLTQRRYPPWRVTCSMIHATAAPVWPLSDEAGEVQFLRPWGDLTENSKDLPFLSLWFGLFSFFFFLAFFLSVGGQVGQVVLPSPSLGASSVCLGLGFWLLAGYLATCRKSVWRLSEQFLLEGSQLISSLGRQARDWRELGVVFRGRAGEHYKDPFGSQRSSFARLFKAVQDVSAPRWCKTVRNWTSLEV